jgi:hypothetical protein
VPLLLLVLVLLRGGEGGEGRGGEAGGMAGKADDDDADEEERPVRWRVADGSSEAEVHPATNVLCPDRFRVSSMPARLSWSFSDCATGGRAMTMSSSCRLSRLVVSFSCLCPLFLSRKTKLLVPCSGTQCLHHGSMVVAALSCM